MLERIFSGPLLHTGAHLGYFSGLTMLLPILGDAWTKGIKPWLVSPTGFLIAFVLILVSLVLLGFVAGSISKFIRGIGWMMLIPGIIAVLFAVFGQAEVYDWAENRVTGFSTAEPVVGWLVEHSVPKVAYLGGAYILIGMILLWIGGKLQAIAQFV
jgi:hypothetical protein